MQKSGKCYKCFDMFGPLTLFLERSLYIRQVAYSHMPRLLFSFCVGAEKKKWSEHETIVFSHCHDVCVFVPVL